MVIEVMRCINLAERDVGGRKAAFHRADKMVSRLSERKGEEGLRMGLKVEIVRYGVRWGVSEGDTTPDEL